MMNTAKWIREMGSLEKYFHYEIKWAKNKQLRASFCISFKIRIRHSFTVVIRPTYLWKLRFRDEQKNI